MKEKNRYLIQIRQWIPIFIIFGIAVFIRLQNNFSTTLIPGINGGYYPFQIKQVLENFSLGFRDMPLVFYFEASVVKIASIFYAGSLDKLIFTVSKIVDAVIPPLIIVPVFLFAKQLLSKTQRKRLFYFYIICAYSIINVTFITILGSDFQKNSIGLVWMAFCLYYLYILISSGKSKYVVFKIILFFLLTFLTHIGVFAALLSFFVCFGITQLIKAPVIVRKYKKHFAVSTAVLLVILFILFFIDVKRFDRLISVILSPFKLFENPVIAFFFDGQAIITRMWLVHMIIYIFLAIFGLIFLLIRLQKVNSKLRMYIVSIAVLSVFLTSPVIGIEWEARLLYIAPVFIVIEYIFIISLIRRKAWKILIASFYILFLLITIPRIIRPKEPHISDESFIELTRIQKSISLPKNSIILTRHGLEWYTGFVFGTSVGQDYSLTQSEFQNYDAVYILKQIRGNNYQHIAWSHFLEVEIPQNAKLQYSGQHFELYQLKSPLPYNKDISYPPITYGKVIRIDDDELWVENERYRYNIFLNNSTKLHLKNGKNRIKGGMEIELWGKRSPFSLGITAHTIHEIIKK